MRMAIRPFSHTTRREGLVLAGVDGSGDFPAVEYADSFVYVSTAQATCYDAAPVTGLKEIGPSLPPVLDFAWLARRGSARHRGMFEAFAELAGDSVDGVISASDYRTLKASLTGRPNTVGQLRDGLIRPAASDAPNIAVQLRSTAELGAALRLLCVESQQPRYLLLDTTLALPFAHRPTESLFAEHLKRLLCVEGRARGTAVLCVSKSHGLPGIEAIEELARERMGFAAGQIAEHWYLRIPSMEDDGWSIDLEAGRRLPPLAAVSYLVRFHRTTPVLRIDLDRRWWEKHLKDSGDSEALSAEQAMFEDLDYACHDQRCYGYPYPIKAGHDRASLTKAERVALRRQIVDAAVRAGMKRSLFRDATMLTDTNDEWRLANMVDDARRPRRSFRCTRRVQHHAADGHRAQRRRRHRRPLRTSLQPRARSFLPLPGHRVCERPQPHD